MDEFEYDEQDDSGVSYDALDLEPYEKALDEAESDFTSPDADARGRAIEHAIGAKRHNFKRQQLLQAEIQSLLGQTKGLGHAIVTEWFAVAGAGHLAQGWLEEHPRGGTREEVRAFLRERGYHV